MTSGFLFLWYIYMRILTWLQVTSEQFHIGNYFWAIKPLIELSEKNPEAEVFLFVANMHSFNKIQDGDILRQNTLNTLKLYLAAWVDPDKIFIYNQADVAGHAQLQRVLTCLTHMWFMERMHAYKDKSGKMKANEISVWLFTYPILMAADILLYDATHVPTGQDQKQHVEYARDIAQKCNHKYGETFVLPKPMIAAEVGVIPGIDGRKMSKSYNNYIWMLDDQKTIKKKVSRIPTAAIGIEEPKDPDACNIYKITKLFINEEQDTALRARYTAGGLSFREAKKELMAYINDFLWPIQEKFATISDEDIRTLLQKNAPRANELAEAKIQEVYEKIGFSV